MKMKRFLASLILVGLLCLKVSGQPVAKAVLVEHFTNSYCGVCASRNPGFYQNLAQYPQAIHIAYYSSSPYPACPINQYNQPEADARTNYYGVYGSTPRLVIQGVPVSVNANYNDGNLIQTELGKTTPFFLTLQLKSLSATVGEAKLVLRKVDTSSLDSLSLYAAVVEDTLLFAANNGEQEHYDVFRRSVWGALPLRVKAPTVVGDSSVFTSTFPIDAAWTLGKMYGLGIAQIKTGALVQVARSSKLSAVSAGMSASVDRRAFSIYPNPATDIIQIENAASSEAVASIYDLTGRVVQQNKIVGSTTLAINHLVQGQYILNIAAAGDKENFFFTKR